MGTKSFRFKEFSKLNELFPAGLHNDIESLRGFYKYAQNSAISILKDDVIKMEKEMNNDFITDNVVVFSDVDYFDYNSKLNTLNLFYNSILITILSFLKHGYYSYVNYWKQLIQLGLNASQEEIILKSIKNTYLNMVSILTPLVMNGIKFLHMQL